MDTRKAERVLKSIHRTMSTGRFVMHGSLIRSSTLINKRPKRRHYKKAYNLLHKAVYGTQNFLVAVMYATFPSQIWRYKYKKEELWVRHRIEENDSTLQVFSGWIHFCPKSAFRGNREVSISRHPVRPVRTIRIPHDVFGYLWTRGAIRIYEKFPGRR